MPGPDSSRAPVTRFAPSPSGRLHVGNARTALFAWLLARGRGGRFLLRIEDTDAARTEPGAEAAILEDLRWLGLDWDEGPDVGGPHGPYRQSERAALHAGLLARLEAAGHLYPCFCTPETLEAARAAQRARGEPPRYPGTCARLAPGEARRRLARGEPAALRFRVPAGRRVAFDDLVRGPQAIESDALGDFVVRRADGRPAFLFASAVDDAHMGVTHVLRGEDHLANTPRQLLLLEALGLDAPRYGHLPLVVDAAGRPLSKRTGAAALAGLRAEGFLPLAVANLLARLGHRYPDGALLALDALAAGFDPAAVARAPARLDPAQLERWQRLALDALEEGGFAAWAAEAAPLPEDKTRREAFLALVRPNVLRRRDVAAWAAILLEGRFEYDGRARAALAEAGAGWLERAAAAAAAAGDGGAVPEAVAAETGARGRKLFHPLRAALTGRTDGPALRDVAAFLGGAECAARLRRAAAAVRGGGEGP